MLSPLSREAGAWGCCSPRPPTGRSRSSTPGAEDDHVVRARIAHGLQVRHSRLLDKLPLKSTGKQCNDNPRCFHTVAEFSTRDVEMSEKGSFCGTQLYEGVKTADLQKETYGILRIQNV